MMKKGALVLLVLFLFLPKDRIFADMLTGTIDSVQKYAWSTGGGWISFGCNKCNVRVDDTDVTGYAWSQNYGWINLSPAQSGVKNDGNGVLSGYAWGQNSGWINFAGVTIRSDGRFVGTATDQANGTINFSCDGCEVNTDWRPQSLRGVAPGGGSNYGSPTSETALEPPVAGFKVSINNGAQVTNKRTVILYLDGGSNTLRMEASNNPNFRNVTEAYERAKTWVLEPGDGNKTVYVKFFGANGAVSQVLRSNIVLDTQPPKIKLDEDEYEFDNGQDVVISGSTDTPLQIFLDWGDSGGIASSEKGRWSLNLGKMEKGRYSVAMKAQDPAGNEAIINVLVGIKDGQVAATKKPDKGSIAENISNLFKPKIQPMEIVKVPSAAPPAMSGKFSLLPSRAIRNFVLAPLPEDIKSLAEKFPALAKTFKEAGISKASDISALRNANLSLPSLGEVVTPPPQEAVPGKFIASPASSTSNLTATEKEKVPTDIVFVRTADGLVDFNTVLSVDPQGAPEQKMTTVAGAPLEFVIKPDKSAKSVKAYIILKPKVKKPDPVEPVSSSGLKNLVAALISPVFASTSEQPEEKMVLAEVEFKDIGGGVFTASTNAPVVDGEYEIITVIEYEDIQLGNKQVRLVSVVDPEGYVYKKTGDLETRISGAEVSLYWLNQNTNKYELWPAQNFQQKNPQTTDAKGSYSFLVPNGYYYLQVSGHGYQTYKGEPFQVSNGSSIHMNIELKTQYWWITMFDWKNILVVALIVLLAFGLLRDKIKNLIQQKHE